jgi:excisionase family DNA binding protein
MTKRLLTVAEAADRLNTKERFVRRLIFERRIPYVKLGTRHVRIDEEDLDRFIEAGRREARARDGSALLDLSLSP